MRPAKFARMVDPPHRYPWPHNLGCLIASQFASALADNALLIVAILVLQDRGLPGWWAPVLKLGFTVSYVALAPFVGAFADALPKARVMALMNAVKVLGVVTLLLGAHPVLGMTIVGIGAAAYAPAKFGLLTELVPAQRLVAANAWLEVSVVCAALLGVVLGGLLVSPWLMRSGLAQALQALLQSLLPTALFDAGGAGAGRLLAPLALLLLLYAVAAALNFGVPDSGARYARRATHPAALLRDFAAANRTLWRDREGALSLAVTTIVWGMGATLQFAVLRWAVEQLGLGLDRAAYLLAAVAVGVILGATAAGRWVPMQRAKQLLGAGVLLGLLLPLVAGVRDVTLAALVLAGVGAAGGFMVVPLNALLQHRGYTLLSAGRSIAVQGFSENLGVLVMLAAYAALQATALSISATLWALGLSMSLSIGSLMWRERRHALAQAAAAR